MSFIYPLGVGRKAWNWEIPTVNAPDAGPVTLFLRSEPGDIVYSSVYASFFGAIEIDPLQGPFSAATAGASVALSDSDHVATFDGVSDGAVLGAYFRNGVAIYFEIEWVSGSGYWQGGLFEVDGSEYNPDALLNTPVGNNSSEFADTYGTVSGYGAASGSLPVLSVGDILGVAYDGDETCAFFVNGASAVTVPMYRTEVRCVVASGVPPV